MAAPTLTAAISDWVIITTTTDTGVRPNVPTMLTGQVEAIGQNVDRVSVGQYVMFIKGLAFSEGASSWAIVRESDINSIITPAP